MHRSILLAIGLVGLVPALPAMAQTAGDDAAPAAQPSPPITITGAATLASQYRFRGISLSDEKVAIQGTATLNHESGVYAGFWASSLDGFGELGGSNVELDIYGGYKTAIGGGMALDAGLLIMPTHFPNALLVRSSIAAP